jgi:hypothetical protein
LQNSDDSLALCKVDPKFLGVERLEAYLLKGMATLMLAKEFALPADLPQVGQWSWVAGLQFATRYIRNGWPRPLDRRQVQTLTLSAPTVLRPEHVLLLQCMVQQAAGETEAAQHSLDHDALRQITPTEFFAIPLLQARQWRLRNRPKKAKECYDALLQYARENGPAFILELHLEEAP